ncbi:Dabb family protein [Snuella sedimenti]|uniref:Dabb family protein n=1 Tax=Snuella sedimenti TaxID=2798802 RepID=A0A8J7LS05_9FLAO|nr:Dabb family protein [Snuella sedimenti]MBJ6367875.1 Dabb family protein [Snuella sedimenti]
MGNFRHTVFFWLKKPDDQSDRNAFETSLKKFIDSSVFVKTKHLGTPANTPREVVDNSFTYCLVVDFVTKEAHDKYQEEPAHKLFIEESSNLWDKVLVYDSENIW